MAFEYDDGNVRVVILGGINKETGKKNPTDLTGYYLRKDSIKTKFGVKPFYVFRTKHGDEGLIGSGNLVSIMETKIPGLLTHVVDTGERKDIGKGNPMKVYKVGQDRSDSLDAASLDSYTPSESSVEDYESTEVDTSDETTYTPPVVPKTPVSVPDAERKARMQAMLKKGSSAVK